MNILIINHYAGSPTLGMEFRPYYMAREWLKMGHQTRIVGASFSHLRKTQPSVKQETIDGISYSWIKTNSYHGNGLGRIRSMFAFIGKLLLGYKRLLRDFVPDVVIASSTYPLDNYVAYRIARHYGAKMVYEIHDLWPLSPMELGGYSANHPFIRVMQRAEDFAYRHCDAVVSMLPKAAGHCTEHGLPVDKFFYVPNGIVEEDWANPAPLPDEHRRLIEKLRGEGRFLVGYLGGHALSNALDTLLDTAKIVSSDNIGFILVGDGVEKENLMRRASNEHIDNVHFLPAIPKAAAPEFLKEMDALYIGWKKNPLYRFGISPNKIYDYMMAGKPVIHSVEAGNDPVAEAHCGLSAEAENPQSIADALTQMMQLSPAERQELGMNGKRFVLANHTYSVLAQRFIDCLEKL
ncbi:MAG: glycosyltransferase family 4 protein [Bacteroidales bacterium]|nr:glycosyltransferase family 4 protein [Bacteroidales bacterium]